MSDSIATGTLLSVHALRSVLRQDPFLLYNEYYVFYNTENSDFLIGAVVLGESELVWLALPGSRRPNRDHDLDRRLRFPLETRRW